MRRPGRLLTATVGALLLAGLTACGDGEEPLPSPTASIEVAGVPGIRPTVTIPEAFTVTETTTTTLIEGDGAALVDGQPLLLDYLAIDVVTGEVVADTYGTLPEIRTLDEATLGGPLYELLREQRIGARVQRVELGTTANPSPHVLVVDVRPLRAVGTALPVDPAMPPVSLDADGGPTVTVPAAAAPTTTSSATLIKGSGPQVSPEQSVVLQLSTVRWSDGAVIDTTWGNAPRAVAFSDLPHGLAGGIVEQTVGSQVVVVTPTAVGAEGGATVYVVDILATADVALPPSGTEGQPGAELATPTPG